MTLPRPTPDELSAPWWDHLAGHRVVVQRCPTCDHRRIQRLPSCPHCGAVGTAGGEDLEVPGTGAVYSFVRVHRPLTPASADEVPYCVATVDLDGGGRVFGRVEPFQDTAIGAPVRARFVDHDDWTELRFELTGT